MQSKMIQVVLGIFLITGIISGCTHEVVSDSEMVSKKDYDDLQKKYNDLLAEKNTNTAPEIEVDLKGEELTLSAGSEFKAFDIESQYKTLELAQEEIGKGEYEKAISLLKEIENSEFKQIKVRAKFLQGEIFFSQKEYDQAMQKYDEIITRYGFSSVAILAIGRKDSCKKYLNLPDTQEPYHLIYKDFAKSS
jgi:tetratricopeptide (TPR) repeat protein